ncbi:hypothetical protein C8R44DRAFT_895027 [Mycena epipterygia]|nr:hypothetical protein C8R44DRAFT_895027 [Mycena epipterygia]
MSGSGFRKFGRTEPEVRFGVQIFWRKTGPNRTSATLAETDDFDPQITAASGLPVRFLRFCRLHPPTALCHDASTLLRHGSRRIGRRSAHLGVVPLPLPASHLAPAAHHTTSLIPVQYGFVCPPLSVSHLIPSSLSHRVVSLHTSLPSPGRIA